MTDHTAASLQAEGVPMSWWPQYALAELDTPSGHIRFDDHADPMLCVCGHSWGMHGDPDGYCDHPFEAGSNPRRCDCKKFVYDVENPANRVGGPR